MEIENMAGRMKQGIWSGFMAALALGCAASAEPGVGSGPAGGCIPGDTTTCACTDGSIGTQACLDDGTLGACSCGVAQMTSIGGAGSVPPSGTGGGVAPAPTSTSTATPQPTSTTQPSPTSTTQPPPTSTSTVEPPPPGVCCTDGNCLCHGPDPTEASATVDGSYTVSSYTDGFPVSPAANFLAATIYHPTDAEPPLAGVVICPGWTALQSSIAGWGPFLASHGIVVMTIDTITTGDSVTQRADELWDALRVLKEENTRAGSPIEGQLSPDRYGLMGWSMGGGGTWIDAAQHPELYTAISLAGHDATAGGATIAAGTTVPSMQFAGALDNAILGGGQSQPVYEIIPETTPKILYEIASADHFAFGTPLVTAGGALGRYGLSFQKVFLEGDERYRQFLLVPGPDASDWRSTVQ
jgi:dienelactone hydrolase